MSIKNHLHHLELLMGERPKERANRATIKLEQGPSKLLASHSSDDAKLTKLGRRAGLGRGPSTAICMRPPSSELKEKPCCTARVGGWARQCRDAMHFRAHYSGEQALESVSGG